MSLCLNDFTNSQRALKVDSVNSISALDQVRKPRFSSIIHLTSIKQIILIFHTSLSDSAPGIEAHISSTGSISQP